MMDTSEMRPKTEMMMYTSETDVPRAARELEAPQAAGRLDAALNLIALSDDLQRLGYPYEAYQLREAAGRLLRDKEAA
jgi:hypothetical protein